MGEPGSSGTGPTSGRPPPPPSPSRQPSQPVTLLHSLEKKKPKPIKAVRLFRSVVRALPIITFTPICRLANIPTTFPESRHHVTGTRVTGTIFGYRKGKVSFSIQEHPKCLPILVIELAMQTSVFQNELASGMVRVALECEKKPEKEKKKVLDEPMWTMFCNGRKTGYSVKREATEVDLLVMEMLKIVSMGAGVLPGKSDTEGPDGEMTYMRAYFDRVVGSKDSETLYMLSPDPERNTGPELSIFFVRL